MKRINSLDYLRGLSAFGIMIYHFILFSPIFHRFDVSGFIERVAIYGVSIFYILSGLTLYLVYKHYQFSTYSDYVLFFKKRIIRILPLFGIITLYVFIEKNNFNSESIKTFILNISGLFSIFSWDKYIITGGWSIGNELFFYLLFPFIIILTQRYKFIFWLFLSLTLLIYCYFSYFILKAEYSLSNNWTKYINPLNQLFLFCSGITIGYISHSSKKNIFYIVSLVILFILFLFYPANGNFSVIMTGNNRIIFTAIIISIVYCTFKINVIKIKWLDLILKTLGEISYGVYLLHPIVYNKVKDIFLGEIELPWLILLSISLTLIISYLSYNYFEIKIINILKRENKLRKL
ncbi:hypothetical protein A6B43_05955 [Vespertiliibacter pulmonis]|uniref:Peptidoglycan/LPS O-acetylase OafA/YrhL n=1 Tax=Vespertiliibacter pulmonis TaxID=1443036 RepID=A0A3N4VR48_9PAST|nr:acyltransferase [Vespertiliibacter pulmonis]QLB21095.1 hypothetical protein A6B43_05955 [Vespertiliibacter pulmonis]RPE83805.1 peptidoglycan/LPS O-acetylase OafA/YrhL [Vespertiliibacter pulmonis]